MSHDRAVRKKALGADRSHVSGRAGAGNSAARIYRRANSAAAAPPATTEDPAIADARRTRLAESEAELNAVLGGTIFRQAEAGSADLDGRDARNVAERGIAGPTSELPYGDEMRAAFGQAVDFSALRVHRGADAATAAEGLGAQAYAMGGDVVLPEGVDRATTAHELAHVAQHRAGAVQTKTMSAPGDADEQQADDIAGRVVAGESVAHMFEQRTTAQGAIHRQVAPPQADDAKEAAIAVGEKKNRIDGYAGMMQIVFDQMEEGVIEATGNLEHRTPKPDALLINMINMASIAAVAGTAGVVASVIAKEIARGMLERFAENAIKDHLKRSFRVGTLVDTHEVDRELRISFRRAQLAKLRAARAEFVREFYGAVGDVMLRMPLAALDGALKTAHFDAVAGEVVAAAARNTCVEWANLVARTHHGKGGWDTWKGELGSDEAMATKQAAPRPDFDDRDAPNASDGNVDEESPSIVDHMDLDQRKMQPGAHGLLEINLWRFDQVYTRPGFGMRMDNVSGYVRRRLSEFRTIGEIRVNKLVHVYTNDYLNPPKPFGRLLIAADGYIREWTGVSDGDAQKAAAFAQSLSPSRLA